MKHLLRTLFIVHALACCTAAQTVGQWELRKRTSTGFTSYGITAENGKAIGFSAGVPAMINVTSSLAIGTSAITGGTSGHVLYNNAGTLGGLDLSTIYQPLDADLTALAGLTSAADALPYFTGAGTAATTTLTATARTLLDDSSTALMRGTLGLGTMATQNANNVTISGGIITGINLDGSSFQSGQFTLGDATTQAFITLYDEAGLTLDLYADPLTSNRAISFGDASGIVLTTGSTGAITNSLLADGTIQNAKLAGSIALSKLATTGTASASTYLRGDGAWSSIDLSTYLPLTGGTLTGPLTLTAGTLATSPFSITQTWNGGTGVTHRGIEIANTATAGSFASATSTHLRIRGGASGTSDRLTITEEKTVITGTESSGRVLDLVSVNGTGSITVLGGGSLFFSNGANASASTGEMRGAQVGNSANYCGILYDAGSALACIRPSTSTLQIGIGASSPTAYSLRGASARAGTDTNTAGASFTLAGGNGTGTGVGGDLVTSTYMTGSSGSAANTIQTRSQAIARYKDLTESTATNIASIALASGKMVGGTASITVWASDGTDHQAITSQVRFAAINKAGTITTTCTQTDGTTAASAGTLAVTYDTTQSGSAILLRASATSSLTQTTLRCRAVITALNGDDVQTVTPQ